MDPAQFRLGTTIADRYQLDDILGRGGMGVVYRATHTLTKREVAVKLLEKTAASDEENLSRFLQEAQAAVKLEHPNVVEVLDMGNLEDGSVYLALELLRGETLSQKLRRERTLSVDAIHRLLVPIMDAMQEAHRLGLVHRDLKPANIFLHESGERVVPKLLDFGIVKSLSDDKSYETKAGQIVGTPHFMAPEQAEGGDIGPAADVWAMAVILYTALSGRLPFRGKNHFKVLYAIAQAKFTPLAEVAPDAPEDLVRAIESALKVSPEERPQDMAVFRKTVLDTLPTLSGPVDEGDDVLLADTYPSDGSIDPAEQAEPAPESELDIPSLPAPPTRPVEIQSSGPSRNVVLGLLLGAAVIVAALLFFLQTPTPVTVVEPRVVVDPPPPPPAPPPTKVAAKNSTVPLHLAAVEQAFVAKRETMEVRDRAYGAQETLDSYLAQLEKTGTEAHLIHCQEGILRQEQAVKLAGKWRIADGMFAQGEYAVAKTYYQELNESTVGLLELCQAFTPLDQLRDETPVAKGVVRMAPPRGPKTKVVQSNRTAKEHYQKAQTLRAKGAIDKAITELDRAIAAAPDFVAALNSRGLLHHRRGRFDAALRDFDRAIKKDDKNASIYHNRAQVRLARRDVYGAIADLDRAIELSPDKAHLYEGRATARAKNGEHLSAAEDFERAAELAPLRPDLRVRQGKSLARAGNHSGAVAALTKALEKKKSAGAHYARGVSYFSDKKLDRAIRDFDATIEMDPKHANAHLQRGMARAKLGEKKKAIADLERFLALAPSSKHRPMAQRWLAQLR